TDQNGDPLPPAATVGVLRYDIVPKNTDYTAYAPAIAGYTVEDDTSKYLGALAEDTTVQFKYRVITYINISGRAMLTGKYRGTPPPGFTPRSDVDRGIRAELFLVSGGAETPAAAPVYTNGAAAGDNFTMQVNGNKTFAPNGGELRYILRFTRIGDNGNTLRRESYLCAEVRLIIRGSNAMPSAVTVPETVYLYAGAYDAPNALKEAISPTDLTIIKSQVGASDDQTENSAIFNVNEYLGTDMADYSNILRYIGKTKDSGIEMVFEDGVAR
ncbi:MAG: hypothetical protein LBH54_02345, partial [Clostridiales bacterium]|nr:hypothetical protein [Clostridiales bacterium]